MFAIILLLSLSVQAKEICVNKNADAGDITEYLISKGVDVKGVQCQAASGKCFVTVADSDSKDVKKILKDYIQKDRKAERNLLVIEWRALEAKIDDDSADLSEIRRLLKVRKSLEMNQ